MREDAVANVNSSQQVPSDHLEHCPELPLSFSSTLSPKQWWSFLYLVHIEEEDFNQGHEEKLYRTRCAC